MKLTRRTIIALSVAAALIVGATTGYFWYFSQDQISVRCMHALKERAEGDRSRPAACDGLTDENYSLLILDLSIERSGLGGLLGVDG
ncbi:hypothetical protein [Streptomyces sp. NPDC060366]|uniref:hypothetical protein n=1 Tax=Streptomyces sp. NPDC060366 TaxID=3347105 RepID=UPI00364B19D8